MELRNYTNMPQSRPTFQANLDKTLAKELRAEGASVSKKMLEIVEDQIGRVNGWGDKASQISSSFSLGEGTRELALFNDSLSSSYGAGLPQRGNILSSFLNLRKQDILKAEKEIEETVSNNRIELAVKAAMDDALAEKITSKILPSDEELAAAIDKLSEEEITNLRFGINENPSESKLLDFVI